MTNKHLLGESCLIHIDVITKACLVHRLFVCSISAVEFIQGGPMLGDSDFWFNVTHQELHHAPPNNKDCILLFFKYRNKISFLGKYRSKESLGNYVNILEAKGINKR